jgi:hypothetical protein
MSISIAVDRNIENSAAVFVTVRRKISSPSGQAQAKRCPRADTD